MVSLRGIIFSFLVLLNVKNAKAFVVITILFFIVFFFRENHEPERLGLNGIADTTVAMEVT